MDYSTTIDFAKEIKNIIDNYWNLGLSKEQMVERISVLFNSSNNRGLALRGTLFCSSFAKILGKKRLNTLKETLKSIDTDMYSALN